MFVQFTLVSGAVRLFVEHTACEKVLLYQFPIVHFWRHTAYGQVPLSEKSKTRVLGPMFGLRPNLRLNLILTGYKNILRLNFGLRLLS